MKPMKPLVLILWALFWTGITETNGQAQAQKIAVYSMKWVTTGTAATPFLQVTLGDGTPRLFALDTGAPVTMIARDLVKPLGLVVLTKTFNPTETYEYVTSAATLGLGALPLEDVPFMLMDVRAMREGAPDISGIIGLNILFNFALRMDFSRKTVDFLLPGKVEGTEFEPKDAFKIPLILDKDNKYYVDATLDGKPVRFCVDTGAYTTDLGSRRLIASLRPKARLDGYTAFVATDSGIDTKKVNVRKMRLQKLTLGKAEWLEPVVEQLLNISKYDSNSLGVDFWRRFRVVFDFPGRMLYLTPDPAFQEDASEWVENGANLGVTEEKKLSIIRVLTPSPAKEAGLVEGDEVVEIDGQSAANLLPLELQRLMQSWKKVGAKVTLKVRHKGEEKLREVQLTSRKLI